MPINTIVGLFAALIGSTATLLGAWAYIRSQHPSKKEMLRASIAITVIMLGILGSAVLISHATTITVNGQKTLPVPSFLAPGFTSTTPVLTLTPTAVPTSQSLPASRPGGSATHSPALTPTTSPILVPASTPTIAPLPTLAPVSTLAPKKK